MNELTKIQEVVLDVIKAYQKEYNRPPTYRDISEAMGYSSQNSAVEHIKRLVAKDYIKITPGISRSIQIIEQEEEC